MTLQWTPYKKGDYLYDCDISVVEVVKLGRTQPKTIYKVQLGCCGKVKEIDHAKLHKKNHRKQHLCGPCANRKTLENNRKPHSERKTRYMKEYPPANNLTSWPVPRSVKRKPFVWGDRGCRLP
jgi:hypothetical protein